MQEERSFYLGQELKKKIGLPAARGNQEGTPAPREMLGSMLETTCPRERGQHTSLVFSVHHQVKNNTQSQKETMMSFYENLQKKECMERPPKHEKLCMHRLKNLWDSCGREDGKKFDKETRAKNAAWF